MRFTWSDILVEPLLYSSSSGSIAAVSESEEYYGEAGERDSVESPFEVPSTEAGDVFLSSLLPGCSRIISNDWPFFLCVNARR